MNKEAKGSTGEPMDLRSKTVAELKEMLKEQGLPVSGKKDELIARLDAGGAVDAVLSLEDDVKDHPADWTKKTYPGGEVRMYLHRRRSWRLASWC